MEEKHFDEELDELLKRIRALKLKAMQNLGIDTKADKAEGYKK